VMGSGMLFHIDSLRDLVRMQGWFWTYTQNIHYSLFGVPGGLVILNHFWSLAIEEQFYLVWPWVVGFASTRNVARVCVLGIALTVITRFAHPVFPFAYMFTLARTDALLLGSLLAVGVRRTPSLVARLCTPTLVFSALATTVVVLVDGLPDIQTPVMMRIGFTFVGLFFTATVASAFVNSPRSDKLRRVLNNKVLIWLGKYSYGLYVYHNIIYWTVFGAMKHTSIGARDQSTWIGIGASFVVLLISVVLSVISYRFYESRFLALKERVAPGT